MTTITLDIETIGTDDPELIAEIAAGIKPPKTMSKPDTIAKWELDEKPALVKDAIGKTSFDGGLGRIICIGWAVDESSPQYVIGEDEGGLLRVFFEAIGGYRMPLFIGHNIAGFDLRFLWQRAVVHGLRPPSSMPLNKKPWDNAIADTMTLWHPDREKRTSLEKLCRILDVDNPKSEMDGSQVWDYFRAGRLDEIALYCMRDVAATRQCYRRMMFLRAA